MKKTLKQILILSAALAISGSLALADAPPKTGQIDPNCEASATCGGPGQPACKSVVSDNSSAPGAGSKASGARTTTTPPSGNE